MIKNLVTTILVISTLVYGIAARELPGKEATLEADWVRANPVFKDASPSLFNSRDAGPLLVFPVDRIENRLYVSDCEDTLFEQLRGKKYFQFSIKEGKEADPVYGGIRRIPVTRPRVILLVNYTIIDSKILDWYKSGMNECPGTLESFGLQIDAGSFNKAFKNPLLNPVFNIYKSRIKGEAVRTVLGIYSPSLQELKKKITPVLPKDDELIKTGGKTIKGMSLDLDNDKVPDIFWYIETLNETQEYARFYLNIDGHWSCKWVELIEECL